MIRRILRALARALTLRRRPLVAPCPRPEDKLRRLVVESVRDAHDRHEVQAGGFGQGWRS